MRRAGLFVVAFSVAVGSWWHDAASAQTCNRPVVWGGTANPGSDCVCGFTNLILQTCGDDRAPVTDGWGVTYKISRSVISGTSECDVMCQSGTAGTEPLPCGSPGCAPINYELCDGVDNDQNGLTDEGACGLNDPGGVGACASLVGDPVQAGSGTYMSEPYVDVRYSGSSVPIEFTRVYTSRDGRAIGSALNGLAAGWYTNFEERGPANSPVPGTAGQFLHRLASGRGRIFHCNVPSPLVPPYTCAATLADPSQGPGDGSLDKLVWTGSTWYVETAAGIRTSFDATGRLSQRLDTRGHGWTVHYHVGGSFDGRIEYVDDDLARRLDFVWLPSSADGLSTRLGSLKDHTGGATLATFSYEPPPLWVENGSTYLSGASSAAGTEEYRYAYIEREFGTPHARITLPYLTTIRRDGAVAVSVGYNTVDLPTDTDDRLGNGAVVASADPTGSHAFYRDTGTCGANAVLIADRSLSAGVCTVVTDCAMPAICDNPTGAPGAGTCRPATCQHYLAPPGGGLDPSMLEADIAQCPCTSPGGIRESYTWFDFVPGQPRRVRSYTSRDGVRTSFAYDVLSRLVARCENDSDESVLPNTTDPSSCPSTGVWTSWEYHPTWGSLPTVERRRSRLSAGNPTTITRVWDASHPELQSITIGGHTQDLSGNTVYDIQTTSFTYDAAGRVASVTGPAGELTTYAYSSTPGYGNGLLSSETVQVGLVGTPRYLTTSYANYTALGVPRTITRPNTVAETYTFALEGGQLSSMSVAGHTTSFNYYGSGRLRDIVEPTGSRTTLTYDARGRVIYEDVFDSTAAGVADRTEYTLDAAGRATAVYRRRVAADGTPLAIEWQMAASYDAHAFQATEQTGTTPATGLTHDAALMGYLTQIQRGDGDQISMQYADPLGRMTQLGRMGITNPMTASYTEPSAVNVGGSLPTRVTDGGGRTRDFTFDDFGHLVKSVGTDYGTQRWRYQQGRLSQLATPQGKRTDFFYDLGSRLVRIDNDAANPTFVGQDYKFTWDNGDVACGTINPCTWRRGRLAKVDIEYASSAFWTLEYAYAQDGQVTSERWPSARETRYEYDAYGRMIRVRMPIATGDMLRYDYDTVPNDGVDPTEVVKVAHELSPGSDYVQWMRSITRDSLGRLATAKLADSASTWDSVLANYTLAGVPMQWNVNRSAGGVQTPVTNRVYFYWNDGAMKRYTSTVATDPMRGAFYDHTNRTTCAVNATVSSCPTPPSAQIVDTYVYDDADNRTSMRDSAGVTTYTLSGNALTGEAPPGRAINYQNSLSQGGTRLYDWESTTGYPTNTRGYTYDGQGRVRQIDVRRAEGGTGVYQQHSITILYDHLGRPLYIADKNNSTLKERREQLYFDLGDNLINRQVTPDSTASTTYTVDVFAHLEAGVVGQMAISYVGGTYAGEARSYVVRDPTGLAVARYSFTGTGATSLKWGAHYGPYGDLIANTTGTAADAAPFRFWGQYEIAGSQAERWVGSSVQQLRLPLVQNMWRVYDPRVGRYLTPDPLTVTGAAPGPSLLYGIFRGTAHGFGYALLDPYNLGDPYGLDWEWLQAAGDFAAAFGDHITNINWLVKPMPPGGAPPELSLTRMYRQWLGIEGNVNHNSAAAAVGDAEGQLFDVGLLFAGAGRGGPAVCEEAGPVQRAPRPRPSPAAPQHGTFYVDSRGNVVPTPPGGYITGSPNGQFIQARDAAGNPTGVRIDGPHNPITHFDPRAKQPHAHVPGVTNPDGTPWLPIF